MNPLIKKEIRLLWPGFLIGCGLAALNVLPGRMWGQEYSELSRLRAIITFLFCPTLAIMVALNSFGVEVSTGTFTSLLAQPMSRLKIWQTKIALLAIALFTMGGIWTLAVYTHYPKSTGDLMELLEWALLFVLVVYSGALWTMLLLRQVAAAFWFTALVPGTILVIFAGLFGGDDDDFMEGVLVIALGVYTLAGLFFARWLFLRAQDVQWSGGTIALPEMRGSPAWLSRLTAWQVTHPRMALWRKEFQLQQSQYVIAFVLLVLQLGVAITHNVKHFAKNSTTEFILENFWWLWLAMPFIIGCAAVAEERKMGTHEGQFCLPVRRATQFTIKLCVVLLLSVLFGVALPLLFEGSRILPDIHLWFFPSGYGRFADDSATVARLADHSFFWQSMLLLDHACPLLCVTGAIMGVVLICFFVSTLCRNTLQALAPALGFLVVIFFLIGMAEIEKTAPDPLWGSALIFLIGVPVLTLAFLILAYRNFWQTTIRMNLWLKNLLTLAITLIFVIVTTAATYHRAWEKLTPFEPSHGPARLTRADPASISEWGGENFVRLPDGRIWMNLLGIHSGTFIPGSDWRMIRQSPGQLAGIKNDGTLWISGKPWRGRVTNEQQYQKNQEAMRQLAQYGSDTDWSSLQPMFRYVILTKKDGTLWRWDYPTNFDFTHKQWPGLQAFPPERIGTESNWAEIDAMDFLHKTDGSIWAQEGSAAETNIGISIGNDLVFYRMAGRMPGNVRSRAEVLLSERKIIGVLENGQMSLLASEDFKFYDNKKRNEDYYEWGTINSPIGQDTNWLAVAGSQRSLVTLRNDGTLWLWQINYDERTGYLNADAANLLIQTVTPTRLGTHSDWIAIASGYGYVLSLAADGSLWYWPAFDSRSEYDNYGNFKPLVSLLDISHKPQYLGNVFEEKQ